MTQSKLFDYKPKPKVEAFKKPKGRIARHKSGDFISIPESFNAEQVVKNMNLKNPGQWVLEE